LNIRNQKHTKSIEYQQTASCRKWFAETQLATVAQVTFYCFRIVLKAKYSRVPRRPKATSIHSSEQQAQTTNTTPVDERILPMPTNGETMPPAAKHTAPKRADAVPEFSR